MVNYILSKRIFSKGRMMFLTTMSRLRKALGLSSRAMADLEDNELLHGLGPCSMSCQTCQSCEACYTQNGGPYAITSLITSDGPMLKSYEHRPRYIDCAYCGASNQPEDNYCFHCNAPLRKGEEE